MRIRRALPFVLLVAGAGGCAGSPQPIAPGPVAFAPGGVAHTIWLTDRADCELRPDPAESGGEPVLRRVLVRGDRVGFERGPDGQVRGVAGPESTDLPGGAYVWRITPDPDLGEPKRETAGEIAAGLSGDLFVSLVSFPVQLLRILTGGGITDRR